MKEDLIIKTIAKNFKKARLSQHLTQVEVAQKAGLSSAHYAKIERGETTPNIVTVINIIKALKSNSSEILPL